MWCQKVFHETQQWRSAAAFHQQVVPEHEAAVGSISSGTPKKTKALDVDVDTEHAHHLHHSSMSAQQKHPLTNCIWQKTHPTRRDKGDVVTD